MNHPSETVRRVLKISMRPVQRGVKVQSMARGQKLQSTRAADAHSGRTWHVWFAALSRFQFSLLFQNIARPFRHSHCDLCRKLICHWFVCKQNSRVYSLTQREQDCWVWQITEEEDRQTKRENPTAQWLPESLMAVPIAVSVLNISCTKWIENEANVWRCIRSRKAVLRPNVPVRMKDWV